MDARDSGLEGKMDFRGPWIEQGSRYCFKPCGLSCKKYEGSHKDYLIMLEEIRLVTPMKIQNDKNLIENLQENSCYLG